MPETVQEIQALLRGNLIVGNHDSITLFGASTQNNLNEISRKVSEILKKTDLCSARQDIDSTIAVLSQMQNLTHCHCSRIKIFFGGKQKCDDYAAIYEALETLNTSLKLKQVAVLRDSKILERLMSSLKTCEEELRAAIFSGEEALRTKSLECVPSNTEFLYNTASNISYWYSRLERKIADLKVSLAIAQQCQVLVNLFCDECLEMIDTLHSMDAIICSSQKSQIGLEFKSKKAFLPGKEYKKIDSYLCEIMLLQKDLLKMRELSRKLDEQREKMDSLVYGKRIQHE